MNQIEAIDIMYSSIRGIEPGGLFELVPEEREMIITNVSELCKAWLSAIKKNPDMPKPKSYSDTMAIVAIAVNENEKFYSELKPYQRGLVKQKVKILRRPKLTNVVGGGEKTERIVGHLRLVTLDTDGTLVPSNE